jgi:hypothetical protein
MQTADTLTRDNQEESSQQQVPSRHRPLYEQEHSSLDLITSPIKECENEFEELMRKSQIARYSAMLPSYNATDKYQQDLYCKSEQ